MFNSALRACLIALAALVVPAQVLAQAYPTQTIKVVVGFPPGGTTDVIGRIVAQELAEGLGKSVVVDNRGGASGIIGMESAARAAPDGYTLVLAASSQLAVNPALMSKLPYDTTRDFQPVILLARTPSLLVVGSTQPVKTLSELVSLAKAKPGALNFASQGNGTGGHLAGELFNQLTGTDIAHVPYKAYSQILPDLFSGQVTMIIDGPPVLLPQIQAGKLRALAVNSAKRLPPLPEVPTFDEAGVPGFWPGPWYGVLAPAGTPPKVVEAVNAAFRQALKKSDVVETAVAQGQTLVGAGPAEFSVFIRDESTRYARLIKQTGAHLD